MKAAASDQLALRGGPATFPDGPPIWPVPDEDVRAALAAAYADGSWGRYEGRHGERLVALLTALHHGALAYGCSSGTVAVELALRGLKIGAGDEVILAGYDFGGNFRCVEAVGATPVLVDIRPQTWCLDLGQLDDAYRPQVKALIVSHLHGGLAPMPEICDWAARRGVAVVEDACQAPGASVGGKVAGTWGDVGVLSFGGSKLLTAGRGGAILTYRPEVLQRIKIYAERGNQAYPLSELQAAVLAPQLEKLAARNAQRRRAVQQLLAATHELPALRPLQIDERAGQASFYKLAWLFEPAEANCHPREAFLAAIRAEGVALDAGFRGFANRSSRRCRSVGALTHSRHAAEATVVLHHPVLLESAETILRVAGAIGKVLAGIPRPSPTQ